ncbi:MAG: hypothetical protein KME46_32350 [Brasilonema angustatum HA4187-MV1]|jgi:hypothetical protein|nr:hypothetical protein [Brasilonema angustatum HA4187-MV1]
MSATKTEALIQPSITQQSLYDGIKAGYALAGFSSPFDEFTENGNNKSVVYKITLDGTKTYGSFYTKIRLTTSRGIGHQIFSNWNATTHVGTNGSTENTFASFYDTDPITVISLNGGTEFKLVILKAGSVFVPLGYMSPANKPTWWDMAIYPYGFIFGDYSMQYLRTSSLTPYNSSLHDLLLVGNQRIAGANSQTNRRDIVQGLAFLTQSNTGVSGKTSDDIVVCAAYGASVFDILQVNGTSEQYLILTNSNGGLGIRIN